MKKLLVLCLTSLLLSAYADASARVTFVNYAAQFDRIEARTRGMPMTKRVAIVRAAFEKTVPGLYTDDESRGLDQRIAKALADFPPIRPAYRDIERRFPAALNTAAIHFRTIFPDFVPPLPIYLAHELGMRDGGSAYLRGRKVMLFGADVIAVLHDDNSLQPFLDHELFHLEHARHFADCDQFWCPLWQEGLATYAASVMNPGADDHQLLLDQPSPIRVPTKTHWVEVLCLASTNFDATDARAIEDAFMGNHHPSGLPARYGYYLGLRIAEEAARQNRLSALARLDDKRARPIVAAALTELMKIAQAPCRVPTPDAPITHVAPRPA